MVGLLVTKCTNIYCEIWYDKTCNMSSWEFHHSARYVVHANRMGRKTMQTKTFKHLTERNLDNKKKVFYIKHHNTDINIY